MDSPLLLLHLLQSRHHPRQVRLLQNHIEVGFDAEYNVCNRHARFSRIDGGGISLAVTSGGLDDSKKAIANTPLCIVPVDV